jgi:hypothetical protein
MKTNKHIQHKIDSTINVTNNFEDVRISPFFKDKIMQRLYAEKEEPYSIWSWFTPKLQLAAIVGIVVLNVLAFSQLDANTTEETIEDFAATFELSDTEEVSLFYEE